MTALGPRVAGETLTLQYKREGKDASTKVTLVQELLPYKRAFIGILPERTTENDLEQTGISIRFVYPDSPAAKVGLKQGDLLQKIDGEQVDSIATAAGLLSRHIAGEAIALDYVREGIAKHVEMKATMLPESLPSIKIPLAVIAKADPNATLPKLGEFELKLPEFPNKCQVFVPKNYQPNIPFGVVIWLHAPNKYDAKREVKRWKANCKKQHLILVLPKAKTPAKWQATEDEYYHESARRNFQGLQYRQLSNSFGRCSGGGTNGVWCRC